MGAGRGAAARRSTSPFSRSKRGCSASTCRSISCSSSVLGAGRAVDVPADCAGPASERRRRQSIMAGAGPSSAGHVVIGAVPRDPGGDAHAARRGASAHGSADIRPAHVPTPLAARSPCSDGCSLPSRRVWRRPRRRISLVGDGCCRARAAAVPVLLAAVFLKMGTYGFLRLRLPLLPDATRAFAPALMAVSAIGIVLAAVAAFAQTSWTRVLAYASLSHLCLVLLGAFALTPGRADRQRRPSDQSRRLDCRAVPRGRTGRRRACKEPHSPITVGC